MGKGMDQDRDMHDMPMSKDTQISSEKMPKGHGKVIDVDPKSNHVTLYHDPIAELGWPSMTMGFKVKDSKQLNNLKSGDEVEFDLKAEAPEKPGMPAQYMIDRVEKTPAMKDGMKGAKP
jgi:Cu/Ag efflux protein CusF